MNLVQPSYARLLVGVKCQCYSAAGVHWQNLTLLSTLLRLTFLYSPAPSCLHLLRRALRPS
jgi:hypothetical protein